MGQDLNILFLFVGKSYQPRDTNRKPFVDGIFFFKTPAKLRLNQLAFVDTMFLSNKSGAGPYLDRVTSYASVVYNQNPDFVFTSFLMGTAFVGYNHPRRSSTSKGVRRVDATGKILSSCLSNYSLNYLRVLSFPTSR